MLTKATQYVVIETFQAVNSSSVKYQYELETTNVRYVQSEPYVVQRQYLTEYNTKWEPVDEFLLSRIVRRFDGALEASIFVREHNDISEVHNS